jgi:hypothetical protein
MRADFREPDFGVWGVFALDLGVFGVVGVDFRVLGVFALDWGILGGGVAFRADMQASGPGGGGLKALAKLNAVFPTLSASRWTGGAAVLALLGPAVLFVGPAEAALLFPH